MQLASSYRGEEPYDTKRDDFLDNDVDEENDFIMKFMDSTCQGLLSNDSTCFSTHNGCGGNRPLEQQIEMLTHCRRPLDFFTNFQDYPFDSKKTENQNDTYYNNNKNDDDDDDDKDDNRYDTMPGAYRTPKDCEYCGAERIQDCNPRLCTRPHLYFQKKRPPFAKAESTKWDPITGHAIESTCYKTKKHNQDENELEDISTRNYFKLSSFF